MSTMNGVQVTQCVPFNAKMTKFCATLDEIQEVVIIQINAWQKGLIMMEILAPDPAQLHVMNPNNSSVTEESFPMDAMNLTFALIELWIIMESCVLEFAHPIVKPEKLYNLH